MPRGKGQTLVTLALFTGVMLVGIATVISVAGPVLDNLQDAAAVDTASDMLSDLQTQIERVAEGGKGSAVRTALGFRRGELLVRGGENEIAYEVETGAEIIAPHTSKRVGRLLLSASATTSVTEAEVDGQDCWRVENDHVQACIRAVDSPADAVGSDTVGFWRFSEGTGQVVVDNSSRGNNGTRGTSTSSENSDPNRTGGLRGNGLDFDGTDDLVQVDGFPNVNDEDFTAAAWIHPDAPASGTQRIIADDQSDNGWWFSLGDPGSNDLRCGIRDTGGGSGTADTTGNVISADRWHHVVCRYDAGSGTITVFVDGVENATGTETSPSTSGGPLQIGNDAGESNHFDGVIDEVRVWNRSLTAEEIAYQYNSTGYLDYVDTRDLLLNYRNKDEEQNLSADFHVKINTGLGADGADDDFTMNGTGTVQPHLTGDHLGRGRVTAEIDSFYGIDYSIVFQLFSGADFLEADVDEN